MGKNPPNKKNLPNGKILPMKERNFHHGKDRYYNNIWRIP